MQSQLARTATAPHPFRSNFVETRADRLKRADDNDWKLFVLSFAAFFVCFYTFIS
ncbi:MAG: hypothetical protein ABIS14_04595 [Sphingomonas sp.]